jgi:glycerol kinase
MQFSRKNWIGAVDQGTTSTRFFVFDEHGQVVASAQQTIALKSPLPGWVEHDPEELVASVKSCIETVCSDIRKRHGIDAKDCINAIGIANQRETTVTWSQRTGRALHPALVWMDTRNRADIYSLSNAENCSVGKKYSVDESTVKTISGLPYSTYFSAGKIKWLIENVSDVKEAIQSGELRFGTVDSWLLWVSCDFLSIYDCRNCAKEIQMLVT